MYNNLKRRNLFKQIFSVLHKVLSVESQMVINPSGCLKGCMQWWKVKKIYFLVFHTRVWKTLIDHFQWSLFHISFSRYYSPLLMIFDPILSIDLSNASSAFLPILENLPFNQFQILLHELTFTRGYSWILLAGFYIVYPVGSCLVINLFMLIFIIGNLQFTYL